MIATGCSVSTEGYLIDLSREYEKETDVKMLRVNDVSADKKNIISGKYPFRRPLYLVAKKDPNPAVGKFIEFVLSRKGQGFISSYGMPSISEIK